MLITVVDNVDPFNFYPAPPIGSQDATVIKAPVPAPAPAQYPTICSEKLAYNKSPVK